MSNRQMILCVIKAWWHALITLHRIWTYYDGAEICGIECSECKRTFYVRPGSWIAKVNR